MTATTRQPDALLGRMESLADPTRLRLLRLLERHELGVAELCDVVQLPQSTVSRHLKMLGDEGWVRSRSEKTANLYSMPVAELDSGARRLWQVAREQMDGWIALSQDQLRLTRRLDAKSQGAQRFFAGAAGEWDRMRAALYGTLFAREALLALLPREWAVADLGCGTGTLTTELAGLVRRVYGVDQSAAMLKTARRRTAELGNVDLRQGSLEVLPLEDACCDAALAILALTYVADVPRALREAARILRPGARLVLVDLLRHDREDFRRQLGQQHPGFEPDVLCGWLKDAGLTEPHCRPLAPEAGAKGPALVLASGTRPSPEQTRKRGAEPQRSRTTVVHRRSAVRDQRRKKR
jgi:ubiquinone/menaquinone biosynthesis C-methylase UbiE/DNA-binding transcriptional ArsR family regulator